VILDITKADEPKLDQVFTAGGHINDAHDVKLGITYNSLFAYVADGKNGMRVVQAVLAGDAGVRGVQPAPTPRLVSTFQLPHGGHIINVARALDRDRAVDENGNQIGVFGGSAPARSTRGAAEVYARDGQPWFVDGRPECPGVPLPREVAAGVT
jgi:hypothetical protein